MTDRNEHPPAAAPEPTWFWWLLVVQHGAFSETYSTYGRAPAGEGTTVQQVLDSALEALPEYVTSNSPTVVHFDVRPELLPITRPNTEAGEGK